MHGASQIEVESIDVTSSLVSRCSAPLLTELGLGEMSTVVRTRVAGGQTSRTDQIRTALQLDADSATELLHLVASSTDLHLRAVALALIPAPNSFHSPK